MKAAIFDSIKLYENNNTYYAKTVTGNDFFKPYLEVFDTVFVLSKVDKIENNDLNYEKLDKKIIVYPLKAKKGYVGLFINLGYLIIYSLAACYRSERVFLRMFQLESIFGYLASVLFRRPICVELVNDPFQFTFVPKLIANLFGGFTVFIVNRADRCAFVTQSYLQRNYLKTGKDTPVSNYSSVMIPASSYNNRVQAVNHDELNLVHVSNNIDDNVKGHLEALNVVKWLADRNFLVHLDIIGDGKFVDKIKDASCDLGIKNQIRYHGLMQHTDVLTMLRTASVFIYPTKTEGLPRVVIEAMSQSSVVVASNVAGIPELLNELDIFEPNDIDGMGRRVLHLLTDAFSYNSTAKRNYEKSLDYSMPNLIERRINYYKDFKNN